MVFYCYPELKSELVVEELNGTNFPILSESVFLCLFIVLNQ